MRYFLRRFRGIIVFAAVEVFFFFRIRPSDLEMFFFVWAFISLILLLYNIFNVNVPLTGLGGNSRTTYANLASTFAEKKYDSGNSKKRSGGGLRDSINLLYLLFLVANIVGYIIVMPK